ncbi:hypothetical protein Tco_0183254 [Tanacetum coccineum]
MSSRGSISSWEDLTTHFLDQIFPPGRTSKLRNDILMFQQHQDYTVEGQIGKTSAEKRWNTIEELAQYDEEGWNDLIFPNERSLNYENCNMEQILGIMESQVDSLMKDAISLIEKSENLYGISGNELGHLPPELSHQEAFEGLLMNFILDQEEKVRHLKEYMSIIESDFMQLSLEVIKKLKEELRIKENNSKRIKKIMRYDPKHVGISCRLGGESRSLSLLEFGWRAGLYSEGQAKENSTRIGMEFVVGSTSVKKVRDPSVRLARYFRILTRELMYVLSVEPRVHTFKKKSLITIEIVMELDGGRCYLPATRQVGKDDEVEEAAKEEAGGSSDAYRNMRRGDWQVRQGQWMDQQYGRWGQLETWMTRHDEHASWMYDHTVRQFQYLSTRDNLDPHL